MPLAHHGGVRQGCVSAGARIGWPERRGSVVHRETHERRGPGVGAYVATAAGAVTMRARRAVCARVEWGSEPPLPPAPSPFARAGLRAHGSSPRSARGADVVPDRAALSGAARVGWAPRATRGGAGRADRAATGGCRAAPLACGETRGCQGQRSGGSTVAAAAAVARGRYWRGRGVLPAAYHGGARRARVSVDARYHRVRAHGDAIGGGGGVLPTACHGRLGGGVRALVCGPNNPSGEGATLVVRHKSAGAGAWGMGVRAAATAGVIAMRVRRTARARVESER